MNYPQAIDFLFHQYPAFEKQGGMAYKPGLDNVLGLSSICNNPHTAFKSIHIAGTNGKGSSANLLASVLASAGYKTGLYTSPHIHDFTERIRINGQSIPKEQVVRFVEQYKDSFSSFQPSFFEITTIMAFDWFATQQVDIAIIETGMGGRLDATNIIQPEVSLITNVSFDHTQFLGDTLVKIAGEKAGIIKQSVPVVLSEYQEEIYKIFQDKAAQMQAPFITAAHTYSCDHTRFIDGYMITEVSKDDVMLYTDLSCGLSGAYQLPNILGVLATIDQLRTKGWDIPDAAVHTGFREVMNNTGFKGRWQIIGQKPMIICDAAHNTAGMLYSMQQLQDLNKRIHIVMGMVKDKDVSQVLALLPLTATCYFCEADSPRAMPAEQLKVLAEAMNLKSVVIQNVNDALKAARNHASEEDVIWIGGSLYVLGELEVL